MTSSTWTFADPTGRSWWGGLWADRVRHSSFATQVVADGLADEAELMEFEAPGVLAEQPDGVFVVPSVEVIARR